MKNHIPQQGPVAGGQARPTVVVVTIILFSGFLVLIFCSLSGKQKSAEPEHQMTKVTTTQPTDAVTSVFATPKNLASTNNRLVEVKINSLQWAK